VKSASIKNVYERYIAIGEDIDRVVATIRGREREIRQMKLENNGSVTVYWYVGKKGLGKATLTPDTKVHYGSGA